MRSTLAKVEDDVAHLEIEVPVEDIERALERAYRKIARNVLIPGFRKGRAPRPLVERHVGKAAIYEEALDDLLPEAYARAVQETGIEPIDRPQISDVKLNEGEPLVFKAVVPIKPEVQLGDYRSIRVQREAVEVTEADVDEVLQQLREQYAELVAVEPDVAAARGHFATVDFRGTVDGQPFAGGSGEGYLVEIGAGKLMSEFEDQLIGMRVGETRTVQVTFPDDHPNAELAGKTATFEVTLRELKRKQLPELNDEFARTVGEFQTLEELRADVQNRLSERAAENAERELRQKVIRQVVEQASLRVPDVLVERRIDQLVQEFKRRLEMRNLKLETYLERQGQTLEALREQFRERAVEDVKTDLVLESVARRENIEPDEDDFAAEAVQLAETYGQKVEDIKRLLERPDVRADVGAALRIRKTVDFLVSLATGAGNP